MCALHEAVARFGSMPAAIMGLDFDSVVIETTPLADGVAMLTGLGGNLAVGHGPDGAVLVDDQFSPLVDKILAAVQALGCPSIAHVINSHWHIDHSGGNAAMAHIGATIFAHDNVLKRMASGQRVDFANMDFKPESGRALPTKTYDDETVMDANGDVIRIVHAPAAHTDGDTLVKWEKANVLHMGDVYVRYGLPFIDLSSGGTIAGFIAGVELGIALSDENTKIIPGHGALATRADLIAFRDGLSIIHDRVAAEKSAGRSLAECQSVIQIEGWLKPEDVFIQEVRPEVFVGFAYDSL